MLTRVPLCHLPTPLTAATRLQAEWKLPELFIKRDDLLGRGLGGNKLRKLEFIVAAAQAQDARALVTTGTFQSNHACLTALAARMEGLHPAVVLMGPSGERDTSFNERLHEKLGTEIHEVLYESGNREAESTARFHVRDRIDQLTEDLQKRGLPAYVVPEGGASLEGSWAFVLAFEELHQQMVERGLPSYDLYVAVGSGSTFAGLRCGVQHAAADVRVRGISIAHPARRCRNEAGKIARKLCQRLERDPPSADELDIVDKYVGAGYGEPTPWSTRTIEAALEHEGLLLDHTYTGKALGAMNEMLQEQPNKRPIVFWHTGGLSGAVDVL